MFGQIFKCDDIQDIKLVLLHQELGLFFRGVSFSYRRLPDRLYLHHQYRGYL